MFWLKRAIQIFFSLWHYFWWNITFQAFIKYVKVILSWYLPKIGTLRAETPNPPWKRWKCSIMNSAEDFDESHDIFVSKAHKWTKIELSFKTWCYFSNICLVLQIFLGWPVWPDKKKLYHFLHVRKIYNKKFSVHVIDDLSWGKSFLRTSSFQRYI